MSEKAIRVLRRAGRVLKSGTQWTKFSMFALETGDGLEMENRDKAVRFDLTGACLKAQDELGLEGDISTAQHLLGQAIVKLHPERLQKGQSVIKIFNDHRLTNFGDIKTAIKEAILIAENNKQEKNT